MKTIFASITLLFASLLATSGATAAGLSADSTRLVAAHAALAKDPSSKDTQRTYIDSFPSTGSSFLAVFMPADFGQLYSTADTYVSELGRIGERFPDLVFTKSLRIAHSLKWDADAVNFLQGMIIDLATSRPKEFSAAVSALPKQHQDGALGFLVSGPHRPTKEFYALISEVRASGNAALASRLIGHAKRREARGAHGA